MNLKVRTPQPSEAPASGRIKNWTAYAAAAGAALALATNADAEIIYSGVQDITVTAPNPGKSTKTFHPAPGLSANIRATKNTGETEFTAGAFLKGPLFHTASTIKNLPILYAAGQAINGNGVLNSTGGVLRAAIGPKSTVATAPNGAWGPGTVNGFAGFETKSGRLGWIQVTVRDPNNDGYPDEAEVIDWAYNNTPGAPINAGDTVGETPEPGSTSLALLASGAAGLLAWRRGRSEVITCIGKVAQVSTCGRRG